MQCIAWPQKSWRWLLFTTQTNSELKSNHSVVLFAVFFYCQIELFAALFYCTFLLNLFADLSFYCQAELFLLHCFHGIVLPVMSQSVGRGWRSHVMKLAHSAKFAHTWSPSHLQPTKWQQQHDASLYCCCFHPIVCTSDTTTLLYITPLTNTSISEKILKCIVVVF